MSLEVPADVDDTKYTKCDENSTLLPFDVKKP
jgi:hypothetical protein